MPPSSFNGQFPVSSDISSSDLSRGVPLQVQTLACEAGQPFARGVPFPSGWLPRGQTVVLSDGAAQRWPLQSQPLAFWPDGSVQWLLVDGLLPALESGMHTLWIIPASARSELTGTEGGLEAGPRLKLQVEERYFAVDTGVVQLQLQRLILAPVAQVSIAGKPLLEENRSRLLLTDEAGHPCPGLIHRSVVECEGPLRATFRFEGVFTGAEPARFVVRVSCWAGSSRLKVEVQLHNPRRAKHPGGQWDLGDPNSFLFDDLSLELALAEPVQGLRLGVEPGQPLLTARQQALLYQDSSGGERWNYRTHVNRAGQVPLRFCGYRLTLDERIYEGRRASPVLEVVGVAHTLRMAVPQFWENFPGALEGEGSLARVRLFPSQFGDIFELQGGERKTRTFWLSLDPLAQETGLSWVHSPAQVQSSPAWLETCGVLPYALPARGAPVRVRPLLDVAVEGPQNLFARRELIDEYGWRHFGDVYADHENLHFEGEKPVVSHFNNQYDLLFGLLLNGLTTGDARWWPLAESLAQHVMDIDIYHTREDKAAYNGGLFWHTDHYVDAETCSHRTYSRRNEKGRKGYGGGPGCQHNATGGLRLFYYLTGDPWAREAVLELADWVLAMDDGEQNVLSLVTEAPTGWASATFDYFGPGRGAGYSLYALVDAWRLTGLVKYRTLAETLIRRTVHPSDDVVAHDLLNAEPRWSYTIFLMALARYLDEKAAMGELDEAYAYGQASLVHYACWMLEHEYPYFDRKETLIYPTETWLGQELRKANVLRMAAQHVDEPLRTRLLTRGEALADRAWEDLLTFESRSCTRSLAIWLVEGLRDDWFRRRTPRQAPRGDARQSFGQPEVFRSQRTRVKELLRSPLGVLKTAGRVLSVARWSRLLRQEGSLKP